MFTAFKSMHEFPPPRDEFNRRMMIPHDRELIAARYAEILMETQKRKEEEKKNFMP